MLVALDGLITYDVKAFLEGVLFEAAYTTGRAGAPRLIAWPQEVAIGQVVKRYQRRRVVGIERRLVHGDRSLLERLLDRTRRGEAF